MTPNFKDVLYVAAILVIGFVVGVALWGCSAAPAHTNPVASNCVGDFHSYRQTPDGAKWYLDCLNQDTRDTVERTDRRAQSWDQENLKRNDKGCPTAIFVAPNGNLTQCQLVIEDAPKKPDLKYFKTVDEAAIYVVGKIYEQSHYYEYGGVIQKTDKGYVVSQPVTQHHGMDVSFQEDPESYNFPIVATYHVHPCLKNAFPSVFSPQDLSGTRTTKNPGYVLDECTGEVHYWAPGDGYLDGDAMMKLGVNPMDLLMGVQLSPGRVVGKIKVDGVVLN